MLKMLVAAVGLTCLFAPAHSSDANAEPSKQGAVDIGEMGPNNQHMIFWRIEERDRDAVIAFLDAGADPDIRGFMVMTPAMWAASSDEWTFVEQLSNRGADLSIVVQNGATVAKTVERAERLQRVRAGSAQAQAQALDTIRSRLRAQGLLE